MDGPTTATIKSTEHTTCCILPPPTSKDATALTWNWVTWNISQFLARNIHSWANNNIHNTAKQSHHSTDLFAIWLTSGCATCSFLYFIDFTLLVACWMSKKTSSPIHTLATLTTKDIIFSPNCVINQDRGVRWRIQMFSKVEHLFITILNNFRWYCNFIII